MSCLQGRPMGPAFAQLLAYEPHGIQLTPGCIPTPGFAVQVAQSGVPVRRHHGFSWRSRRRRVWDGAQCLVAAESVHPPSKDSVGSDWLERWAGHQPRTALEVMYPGHWLGTGEELDQAMDFGIPLAVDVSHLFIQETAGVLGSTTRARLESYGPIAEVHVSDNDGRHDSHRLVHRGSPGLGWALERLRDGVPVILESYLHRCSDSAIRGALACLMEAA